MNVLVLASRAGSAQAELLSELENARHLVRAVSSAEQALEQIGRDPPDIAIISREAAGASFGAILSGVVGADALYRSVFALVDDDTPQARLEIYSAGADDIAGPSVTGRELASRIRSVERIVRLERRLRERVCELESALKRLELQANRRAQAIKPGGSKAPPDPRKPFLLTSAWSGVEEVLAKMCSEYLQAPYQLVAGMDLPSQGSPGTQISLTDIEHDLRVDLAFFAPAASAHAIATAFCGDPEMVDDDMIRDVMLELGNSGMGAVKAAFLTDGFRFAGSLPKPTVFSDAGSFLNEVEAKRVLSFRSETSVLYVLVAVRRKPRVRIKVESLREGMILATEIKNSAGVLLVSPGTRLSETACEKLRRMVPKLEVELADPG